MRLRGIALLGLLAAGCSSIEPIPVPGLLNAKSRADSALGWARLADQNSVVEPGSWQRMQAYVNAADLAEQQGDSGAAVVALEEAYRLSFRQTGVPRWDQEAQRVKLARRLEAIKAAQGRTGAASAYAVMAALGEAYEDSGQADIDRQRHRQAEAALAEARRKKSEAEAQAMANFLSAGIGSMADVGLGNISSEQGMLQTLQASMDYVVEDAAISDASRGLGESEAALRNSTLRQSEDRAARLVAIYLASTNEPAIYARAVQKAVRRHAERSRGATGAFLALAPPDSSRSSKKEFVQAYQAAEQELRDEDFRRPVLATAALKALAPPAGGVWDAPLQFKRTQFFIEGYSVGSSTRMPVFEVKEQVYDYWSGWETETKKVSQTVQVASAVGAGFSVVMSPFPGSGGYLSTSLGLHSAELSTPKPATFTGSAFTIQQRIGGGFMLGSASGGPLQLSLGVSSFLYSFVSTSLTGPRKMDTVDFEFFGVDLEAAVYVYQFLRIGAGMPLMEPISSFKARGSEGLRIFAGVNFAISPGGPKDAAAIEAQAQARRVKADEEAELRRVAEAKARKAAADAEKIKAAAEDQGISEAEAKRQADAEAKRLKEEQRLAEAKKKKADAEARRQAELDAKQAAAEKKEADAKAKLEAAKKAKADADAKASLDAERKAKQEAEKALAAEKLRLEREKAESAVSKEAKALRKEREALAAERKKLQAEREAQREKRTQADKGERESQAPTGRDGGLSFHLAYWRPGLMEKMETLSNDIGSASGDKSTPFEGPITFGLGARWGSLNWENTMTASLNDGKMLQPISKGSNTYKAYGTQYAGFVSAFGWDWHLAKLGRVGLFVPMRAEVGATWVTTRDLLFFGPSVGLSSGLGTRWPLGANGNLDLSARYHLGMDVSGLNADNGERLTVGTQELNTDNGSLDLRLAAEWMLW